MYSLYQISAYLFHKKVLIRYEKLKLFFLDVILIIYLHLHFLMAYNNNYHGCFSFAKHGNLLWGSNVKLLHMAD